MTTSRSLRRMRAPRAAALAALLAAGLFACSDDATDTAGSNAAATTTAAITADSQRPLTSTAADGSTTVDADALAAQLPAPAIGSTLTQAEIDSLRWMREEEKLAHDVYVTFADAWGLQIFTNIARSEQSHTDAVKTLLDRYDIADPSEGRGVGEFTDPAIQSLYDELVARGLQSSASALDVGATIEDLDIVDLQQRASATPDIDLVYDNLELGSRNHLRAFVSNLQRQGPSYTPQYLSPDAYQAIITSATERGAAS